MLGEGSLALASTLAAVAGMGLITACNLPSVGMVENLSGQCIMIRGHMLPPIKPLLLFLEVVL
jgi:hypothetical protein